MADTDTDEVKPGYFCDLCRVTCCTSLQLFIHLVGCKHRWNIKRLCPANLPHTYRLHYILDTYMKLEPLVGLEYVEEVKAGGRYRYKCQLCAFFGNRKPAFLHVIGPEHIEKYIMKHHPELSVHAAMYPQKKEYLKALQQAAAKICELYGKKKIKEAAVGPTPLKNDVEIGVANDRSKKLHVKPRHRESKRDQCGFSGNSAFLDYLQKFEIRNQEDAGILQQITRNCTQALVRYWHDQAQLNEPPGDVTERFFKNVEVGGRGHPA